MQTVLEVLKKNDIPLQPTCVHASEEHVGDVKSASDTIVSVSAVMKAASFI